MTGRQLHGLLAVALMILFASCQKRSPEPTTDPLLDAYDTEVDWTDAKHLIPLNYEQSQGKRIFYAYCVWCHADSTPAGPSNRSNLNPVPPLGNDGSGFNPLSDNLLRSTITLGGSALGKSAMMPPWGQTLTQGQIDAVIAFLRAIAQPAYQPPSHPGPNYSVK
jgi:mono/diheme cytochrome c family protein